MAARPPSRGKLLDTNAARPPSRSLADIGMRPGSSPRVMLQPLQPPNSQGFAGGSNSLADEKEYLSQLKKEIRRLASKVAEYSAAVETDRRMADSSSLLRRPLTPGSANRPGTSDGQASVGHIAGNIDTFLEKATAGKGAEQAKSSLLELLLTVLEDAQRCTLMLTEKRAPLPSTVPAPSVESGRMGSRVPVSEALMERTLQLHGAVRPADDAERTRPMTGSTSNANPGLPPGPIAALLGRLVDLHEHFSAIAEGKRDAGDTMGGQLLDELDASIAALSASCTQQSKSKVSDAAARLQKEARDATLAISTAIAMSASGGDDGSQVSVLRHELENAREELAAVRSQGEAANAKSATEIAALRKQLGDVAELQKQLDDKETEAWRLRKQVVQGEMTKCAVQGGEEEAADVARDLVAAAKMSALEAANAQLTVQVKQLQALLEGERAGTVGSAVHGAPAAEAAAPAAPAPAPPHAPALAAPRPSTAAVMGRPGTAAALSVDQLRQEWLSLRGELGIARSQLASTRQDKVQLETRLRSEKEKMEDLQGVCEAKDEQLAHLKSELRSLERLNSASGNADSFEAVLAEEMHAMRESFEQKMLSLKAQIDRDNSAFARERKEMRENFDKEAKAMKRQIEILQVRAGDYSQAADAQGDSGGGVQVMSLDD